MSVQIKLQKGKRLKEFKIFGWQIGSELVRGWHLQGRFNFIPYDWVSSVEKHHTLTMNDFNLIGVGLIKGRIKVLWFWDTSRQKMLALAMAAVAQVIDIASGRTVWQNGSGEK